LDQAAGAADATRKPGHHDALVAVSALWRAMRIVERLTARQLFLEALRADIVYDRS
jgi:hypothetical protein